MVAGHGTRPRRGVRSREVRVVVILSWVLGLGCARGMGGALAPKVEFRGIAAGTISAAPARDLLLPALRMEAPPMELARG